MPPCSNPEYETITAQNAERKSLFRTFNISQQAQNQAERPSINGSSTIHVVWEQRSRSWWQERVPAPLAGLASNRLAT
jgi:hypothetical protein